MDNCYTLARRELKRLAQEGYAAESLSVERWGHVLRICELVGCVSAGVLREASDEVRKETRDDA